MHLGMYIRPGPMEGLFVDLRTAEDETSSSPSARSRARSTAAGDEHPVRRAPGRVARDDDVRSAGSACGNDSNVLRPNDDAVPHL